MTTFIYALFDAKTPHLLRYVGKSNDPSKRMKQHIREARTGNAHRHRWIRSVDEIGFVVLEETTEASWPDRERHWIAKLIASGYALVNGDDGGLGGRSPSPEARAKISAAQKAAWTDDRRSAAQLAMKSRTADERKAVADKSHQTRCLNGNPITPDPVKVSEAARKRVNAQTPEELAHWSSMANRKRMENSTPEQRSSAARKGWEGREKIVVQTKPCSMVECNRTAKSKGLCFKHYQSERAKALGWPSR